MRRAAIVGLVGVAVSLGLISEALAAPNATVTDKVKASQQVVVAASNCTSESSYTAQVDIIVANPDGVSTSEYPEMPTDQDPATVERYEIPMQGPGIYGVRVICTHVFASGSRATWYDETEQVTVTGLTDDERKKCKKKKTKKARKRCLKRARAN